ncbi:MAG: hypothetical protein Q4C42_04565 [Clostridia bacterium]|nr:hypothetical protein [Clostridia bacterium]
MSKEKYLPKTDDIGEIIMAGYKKIAFGDIKDAVRLAFSDELTPRELARLDLFAISELKRPKGGGLEIKFFDRIKALQCLAEYSGENRNDGSFFTALEKSASSMNSGEDEVAENGD